MLRIKMLVLHGFWLPPRDESIIKGQTSLTSGTGGPGMEDGAVCGAVGVGQSMVVTGMGRYCGRQGVDHSQGMQHHCLTPLSHSSWSQLLYLVSKPSEAQFLLLNARLFCNKPPRISNLIVNEMADLA